MGLLDGRVAIVAGASTGIGNATARALADEGARVVVAARDDARLSRLCTDIEAAGGAALAVPTDVTDDRSVEELVDRTHDVHGRLDILVNSAGVADWSNEAILGADLDQWRREIDTNLVGLMSLTRHAAATMRERGGDIVNISSGADQGFAAAYPAYVTSKWGVRGFTGSAMLALREEGIRVTLLAPGEVATPMQPEEDIAAMRMLDAEDVAHAVVFSVTRPRHVFVSEIRILPSGLD